MVGTGRMPSQMTERSQLKTDGDLARVELAFEIRKYHHGAIWEEQKHFTWLISILLSAIVIGATSDRLSETTTAIVVLVGSMVGCFLAVTAFRVQRREGEYFRNANASFVDEWNLAFPSSPLLRPPARANRPLYSLIGGAFIGKIGVRDYFQLLFVAFAVAFTALTIFGIVSIWPSIAGWARSQGWI